MQTNTAYTDIHANIKKGNTVEIVNVRVTQLVKYQGSKSQHLGSSLNNQLCVGVPYIPSLFQTIQKNNK